MLLSLPQTTLFTEDYYGSSVSMTVDESSRTAVAMYHPPRKVDANDPNNTPLGISILRGSLEPITEQKGSYIFAGTWEYLDSDHHGIFEMVVDSKGKGEGWWSLAPDAPPLGENGKTEIGAESKKVQKLREEIKRLRKTVKQLKEASERGEVNEATSVVSNDKWTEDGSPSKTLPKESWHATGTTLVHKAPKKCPWKWNVKEPEEKNKVRDALYWFYIKNCVFCSWIFLIMTLISLLLCANIYNWFNAPMLEGIAAYFLNYAFMLVYTVIYAYFLVMYFYLQLHPPAMYVLGVLLYTIGYAVFAGLFLLAYHDEGGSEVAVLLNYIGSWSFLIGSVALVQSTVPKSYCSKEVFLFLGSVFFLLGSFFFVFGCSQILSEYLDPHYSTIGNALFLPGRLCFLIGSTSDDCDILCRGAEWQKRGLFCCFERGLFGVTKDDVSLSQLPVTPPESAIGTSRLPLLADEAGIQLSCIHDPHKSKEFPGKVSGFEHSTLEITSLSAVINIES